MSALVRETLNDDVVILRSRLLAEVGVPHAFSTRHGGVSRGPFASLNLAGVGSTGGEDDPVALRENRARFLRAAQVETRPLALIRQVHGSTVACGRDVAAGAALPDGADALVADRARPAACMIRVADCVPILLAEANGGAVAAIHAGWRGIVAGVVGASVEAVRSRTSASDASIVAAIGPCAGVERFEVGEEVASAFEAIGLAAHVHRRDSWSKPHLDLYGAVFARLVDAGVDDRSIDGLPVCTMERSDDFFSHRRDRGVTGRMAAVIAPGS